MSPVYLHCSLCLYHSTISLYFNYFSFYQIEKFLEEIDWIKKKIVVVQLLSWVWLFATPWTAAFQTSLSFTTSQNLLKLMSIELVIPSNHLILCHPLFLLLSTPASGYLPISWVFASGGQIIVVSASTSVLPVNTEGWFPSGLTDLISLLSKGLIRVFSSTTVQRHWFFGTLPFLLSSSHIHTWLLEKPELWLDGP